MTFSMSLFPFAKVVPCRRSCDVGISGVCVSGVGWWWTWGGVIRAGAGAEQLVSRAQTRAVCRALALLGERFIDGQANVAQLLGTVDRILAEGGLDVLDARRTGDMAAFRRFELVAALSRLRSLAIAAEE